ncbi:hypothetical protein JBE04_38535 [Streptomyces sp. PRKS01-29]|nr:hypothetical protein [Streptomyces sabulosicollis]MBI0300201.1 hypothetical protein [Streptomyces sabulosicollis]
MPTTTNTTTTPNQPDPAQLSGTTAAVWAALTNQPGTTSTTLAQAASAGRSTTTKALRVLEQNGLARRETSATEGPGRPTNYWYAAPAPDNDTGSSSDTADKPSTGDSADPKPATSHAEDPTHTAQPPTCTDDTTPHSQAHANDPDAEENRHEVPSQATYEAEQETTSDGLPTPTPAPTPAAMDEGTVPPGTGTPEVSRPTALASQQKIRLAPGALRHMVIDHLTAHPDEAFTATRISRIIGKSSGAIANALATLAKQGVAEQVTEHPRTYRRTARPASRDA